MAPKIEPYDQATVIPQWMINGLISQHFSLAAPEELHVEDEHGAGISDIVPGIPQVIVDVEGPEPDRVLLVLPLLSGQVRLQENTNPNDPTGIEYAIRDWQLVFPVRVNAAIDTTPNPKHKLSEKARRLQKEYQEIHNRLKTNEGITVWDWLMRIGGSEYGRIDLTHSSFGSWTDEDFHISEEGSVPATQRFAAGQSRKWPVDEPKWFGRFVDYLDQFSHQLWQSITLDLFQRVAARLVSADGRGNRTPVLPSTSLCIQPYPWLNGSQPFRTGMDGQSCFNSLCFLETVHGGSPPETRRIPQQGNWSGGADGVYQLSIDHIMRTMSPILRRYNFILRETPLVAKRRVRVDFERRDLPSEYEFRRYWGKDTSNIGNMLRDQKSEHASFWDGGSPENMGALPSNALVWTYISNPFTDVTQTQNFGRSNMTIGVFTRLSILPGTNQMRIDTRYQNSVDLGSEDSTRWFFISWSSIQFDFRDGPHGLAADVSHPDFKNLPHTLSGYGITPEASTKVIQRLEHLRTVAAQSTFGQLPLDKPLPELHGPFRTRKISFTESGCLAWELGYPRTALSVRYIPHAGPDGIPANATVAAASRDTGTVEIWWVATDGSVQGAYFYEGESWRRYYLAGPKSAVPGSICATSCDPLRLDVFWIAPDRSIQGCSFHRATGWSSSRTIPGRNPAVLSGTIEAVTWAPGALAVLWTDGEGRVEGAFSLKPGLWVPREVMPRGTARAVSGFRAVGCPVPGGFDLFTVSTSGQISGTFPRWDPAADLPEKFTAGYITEHDYVPGSSRLAMARPAAGYVGHWQGTSSGGIIGAQNFVNASGRRDRIAPDGSIGRGGSLQAASRAVGMLDVLWISETGVLRGCGGSADPFRVAPYTIRDDPVAAPESPLTVLCRRQGSLDVWFRGPSGRLLAGIIAYD